MKNKKEFSGICYKITDLDTGKFYIGATKHSQAFLDGAYNGSGRQWRKYFEEFKDTHEFKREILKDDFASEIEMHEYEIDEIRKYSSKIADNKWMIDNNLCMNKRPYQQSEVPPCPECGSIGKHRQGCSKFSPMNECPKCGSLGGKHKKHCPDFKELKKIDPELFCPHCGTPPGGFHKKSCPNHSLVSVCPECHTPYGNHTKSCSMKKILDLKCDECGGIDGHHKKYCSFYKEMEMSICPECGNRTTQHKSSCSMRNNIKDCPHCGAPPGGFHKKNCPDYVEIGVCEECGGKRYMHKKGCSLYIERKACPECGSKALVHKKNCSFRKN